MAENKNSPKPESASKPGEHAYEERDRASEMDQDNKRGDRNPGSFRNDPERASEAGRKGGQR